MKMEANTDTQTQTRTTTIERPQDFDTMAHSVGDRITVTYETAASGYTNTKTVAGEISATPATNDRFTFVTDDGEERVIGTAQEYDGVLNVATVNKFGNTRAIGATAIHPSDCVIVIEASDDQDVDADDQDAEPADGTVIIPPTTPENTPGSAQDDETETEEFPFSNEEHAVYDEVRRELEDIAQRTDASTFANAVAAYAEVAEEDASTEDHDHELLTDGGVDVDPDEIVTAIVTDCDVPIDADHDVMSIADDGDYATLFGVDRVSHHRFEVAVYHCEDGDRALFHATDEFVVPPKTETRRWALAHANADPELAVELARDHFMEDQDESCELVTDGVEDDDSDRGENQ